MQNRTGQSFNQQPVTLMPIHAADLLLINAWHKKCNISFNLFLFHDCISILLREFGSAPAESCIMCYLLNHSLSMGVKLNTSAKCFELFSLTSYTFMNSTKILCLSYDQKDFKFGIFLLKIFHYTVDKLQTTLYTGLGLLKIHQNTPADYDPLLSLEKLSLILRIRYLLDSTELLHL